MKIKKLLTTGILLTMTAVFMAGCGTEEAANTEVTEAVNTGAATVEEAVDETDDSEDQAVATDDLIPVRIAAPSVDTEGNATLQDGAVIAQELGYLEEELNAIGYTPEYYGFATAGVGVNEALAAKEIDIAAYGDYPAFTYISAGNDAKIFGFTNNRYQMGIYATEDIQSVQDLAGKKIGTILGTATFQYLVGALEKAGLSVNDVEIVNTTNDAGALFASGDIDAISQNPQLFYTLQGGHIVTVNGDDPDLANNMILLGRTEFLDENPDVPKAILKALTRAQEYASQNPEEVYQIFADKSGYFTVDIYKDYYKFDEGFNSWIPDLDDEKIASLQKTADFQFANQYIPQEVNVTDHILNVE